MHFIVISLFPDMFHGFSHQGVCGRAFESKQASVRFVNPRDYAQGNYKRVDERPAGGGPGMVMMAEPLIASIEHAKQLASESGVESEVIYFSPQGVTLSEQMVCIDKESCTTKILLCGRYEGVDERVIESLVDREISVGDFVLSGGELPAMLYMDALIRRIPGALGDSQSAEQDSFVEGLLDCPHYTKPDEILGKAIPAVLKSGDHKKIAKWRFLEQYTRTQNRRPDLLASFVPSKEQEKWLQEQHWALSETDSTR